MWRPLLSRKRSEASPEPARSTNLFTQPVVKQSSSPTRRTSTLASRTALAEVLKNNAFRSKSREALQIPVPRPEDPVELMNQDLRQAASVYPDVQLDVLRELLFRFDGDSRLQVCVEQLFRYKSEWARGRLVNPPRDPDEEIPKEELFRHPGYVDACKRTLYNEFKALNKSAIDAVLAEVNNSYTKARPILQEVAAKTWRATLVSFFRRKRTTQDPPSNVVAKDRYGNQVLLSTDNAEFDAEVYDLFIAAFTKDQIFRQTNADHELACRLNFEQAEEHGALFECQCCFDDVPFEQVVTCVNEGHVVCIECVRRTFNEAVFGQSWNKSIDTSLATLTCFVPLVSGRCKSHIDQKSLRTAVVTTKSGHETWSKYEQRLANDNLSKTGLPLESCPFCSYAEVRESHTMQTVSRVQWRFRVDKFVVTMTAIILVMFLMFFSIALLAALLAVLLILPLLPPHAFQQTLINLSHQRQTHRFKCRSPRCGKKSCTVCHKQWHDPHVCHEPLILSLRNTVEAARTAALKRVCPRCGMGFVKSSGCNKLVCVCGYAMCYLCRKNIGKVSSSAGHEIGGDRFALNLNFNIAEVGRNQIDAAEDADIVAAGEGYRHFCPHFRPLPGQKCTECDKCDLYKTEDEEAVVRHAGEAAEREWRANHEDEINSKPGFNKAGFVGLDNALAGIDDADHRYFLFLSKRFERTLWKFVSDIKRGRLSVQGVVDSIVEKFIIIEDEYM